MKWSLLNASIFALGVVLCFSGTPGVLAMDPGDEELHRALRASRADADLKEDDEELERALEASRTDGDTDLEAALALSRQGGDLHYFGDGEEEELHAALVASLLESRGHGAGAARSDAEREDERERLQRDRELRDEQDREFEAVQAEDRRRAAVVRQVEQRREALEAVTARVQKEHGECEAQYVRLSQDQELQRELRTARFNTGVPSDKMRSYTSARERADFLQGKLIELEGLDPTAEDFYDLFYRRDLDAVIDNEGVYTVYKSTYGRIRIYKDPVDSKGWEVTPRQKLTFTFRIEGDEFFPGFGYALIDQHGKALRGCEKQFREAGEYRMTVAVPVGVTHIFPMIYGNLTRVERDVSFRISDVAFTISDES